MELQVKGAEDLATLAKALRKVGDKELRRELYSGIQRATKPTKAKIKANAAILPTSGGLAGKVAASKIATRTRGGGRNPGVRLEAKAPLDVRSLDRGRLRHPVFGNREKWVQQQVPEGWFSDPIREDIPHVRDELLTSMRNVAEKFLSK